MGRLVALGAILVALAGCGGESTPAAVVPADASAYVGVDRRAAPLLARGAGLHFPAIEPWLGERAALFASRAVPDEAAFAFAVRDEEAAAELATGTRGYPAGAIVEGHLVLATSRELLDASIAAAKGDSLADTEPFDERGPSAFVWANDTRPTIGALMRLDDLPQATERVLTGLLPRAGGVSARVWLEGRATRVEVEGMPRPPAPGIADLPGSAWLAIGDGEVGRTAALLAGIGMPFSGAYQQLELASGLNFWAPRRPSSPTSPRSASDAATSPPRTAGACSA